MAAKIDHARIESLVRKYRRDSTVFKYYRERNKSGKKEIVMRAIASARSNLPLRVRNPKMYKAKIKQQGHRMCGCIPHEKYMKKDKHHPFGDPVGNYPPYVRAAKNYLNNKNQKTPLKCVKELLTQYEKKAGDLTTEIEDLKMQLIKAEAEQSKVRSRIGCIKAFLADGNSIAITKWILEA